jgi:hypothetical protein
MVGVRGAELCRLFQLVSTSLAYLRFLLETFGYRGGYAAGEASGGTM